MKQIFQIFSFKDQKSYSLNDLDLDLGGIL